MENKKVEIRPRPITDLQVEDVNKDSKVIGVNNGKAVSFEVDKANGLAKIGNDGKLNESVLPKIEIDSQIQPINLSTETPTKNGVFEPLEVGVYTNFGGLELTQQEKDSSIVYFYLLNGVFSKQVKSVSTTDVVGPNNTNAISSRGVYNFSIRNVSNIAELRTIVGEEWQKVNLLGYYEAGDKPPLLYKWVSGVGEDDGGSVINSTGGRWEALLRSKIYFEDFGIKGSDNTEAIQKTVVYASKNNIKIEAVKNKEYFLTKSIFIPSNVIFHANNCTFKQLKDTVTLIGCIYNDDRDKYSELSNTDYLYYEYKASTLTDVKNPLQKIITDSKKNTRSVRVLDSKGFKVGDYVYISNGYCDMWRVLESESVEPQRYVNKNIDLWRCEINKIKSISNNIITLEKQLENDYLVTPKTFGFFDDENVLQRYNDVNTSYIERLGGSENITIKDLNIISDVDNAKSIRFDLSVNLNFENIKINNKKIGYELWTCHKSKIIYNDLNCLNYNISVRRGSTKVDVLNNNTVYNSGDASVLVWEGSNNCNVDDLKVLNMNNDDSKRMAGGLYFNTCWNNNATNIFGECLDTTLMIGFCRGGNIADKIQSINCNSSLNINESFGNLVENISHKGFKDLDRGEYSDSLFSLTKSSSNIINNIIDTTPNEGKILGRIHNWASYDNVVNNLFTDNLGVDESTMDAFISDLHTNSLTINNSRVKYYIKRNTYERMSTNISRFTELNNVEIIDDLLMFTSSKIKGNNVAILSKNKKIGLIMNTSTLLFLKDTFVGGVDFCIDFRGNGSEGASYFGALSLLDNVTYSLKNPFKSNVSLEKMLKDSHGFITQIDKQYILSDSTKEYDLKFRVNKDKTYNLIEGSIQLTQAYPVNFSSNYSQNTAFGEASILKKGDEVAIKLFANKSTDVQVGDTLLTLQPELRPKSPEFLVGHGGNGDMVVWLMIEPNTGNVTVKDFPNDGGITSMNAIILSCRYIIRE